MMCCFPLQGVTMSTNNEMRATFWAYSYLLFDNTQVKRGKVTDFQGVERRKDKQEKANSNLYYSFQGTPEARQNLRRGAISVHVRCSNVRCNTTCEQKQMKPTLNRTKNIPRYF